jgi:hypothetical protein
MPVGSNAPSATCHTTPPERVYNGAPEGLPSSVSRKGAGARAGGIRSGRTCAGRGWWLIGRQDWHLLRRLRRRGRTGFWLPRGAGFSGLRRRPARCLPRPPAPPCPGSHRTRGARAVLRFHRA